VANSDVISAVSETLEARLTAGLSMLGNPAPTAKLHDLVTVVTGDPPLVTLFLYQVLEDRSVRNRAKTTRVVNGDKPPLGLCLHCEQVALVLGDRHGDDLHGRRAVQQPADGRERAGARDVVEDDVGIERGEIRRKLRKRDDADAGRGTQRGGETLAVHADLGDHEHPGIARAAGR
jgi:hypothetical protein